MGKLKQKGEGSKEEILRAKLSKNPNDAATWADLGSELTLQGKFEEAEQAYERALSIDKKEHVALLGLSTFAFLRKEYDKSIELMNEAVKAKDDYFEGWISLGQLYLQLNKHKDARKALEKAVKLNPGSADGWYHLSLANRYLEQYDDAAKAIQKALQINAQHIELWLLYITICSKLNDRENMLNGLKKALEIGPKEVGQMIRLGMSLSESGDNTMKAEAIKLYQRAFELKPDEPSYSMAWIDLVKLLKQLGRHEEADATLKKVYPHLPDAIRRGIPDPS